ncbi:hypothetical protein SAVIM338S_00089 [Streptomyces avidinii]
MLCQLLLSRLTEAAGADELRAATDAAALARTVQAVIAGAGMT